MRFVFLAFVNILVIVILTTKSCNADMEADVLSRVKRFGGGGGGGGSCCGGGGYGTRGTRSRVGGGGDQTLKILLGAKTIILKGILLKNIFDRKNNNNQNPNITSVSGTTSTTTTAAPAAG